MFLFGLFFVVLLLVFSLVWVCLAVCGNRTLDVPCAFSVIVLRFFGFCFLNGSLCFRCFLPPYIPQKCFFLSFLTWYVLFK